MKGHKVLFSKKSNHWSTPKDLYEELNKEFMFSFDPCPLQSEDVTWLLKDWTGRAFINPPYSNIANLIDKALLELKKNNIEIAVFLIPSRTDTKWFHKYILCENCEIRFIKGRLKFGNNKNSAPFPSMIIIFRRNNIRRWFRWLRK